MRTKGVRRRRLRILVRSLRCSGLELSPADGDLLSAVPGVPAVCGAGLRSVVPSLGRGLDARSG